MMLGLHADSQASEILETLAKTFGGLFQAQDDTENFVAFEKPGTGDIDFIVAEAIKHNPVLGRDSEAIAKYIQNEEWRNSSKVWNKPSKGKE
jgi:hypothetical protein